MIERGWEQSELGAERLITQNVDIFFHCHFQYIFSLKWHLPQKQLSDSNEMSLLLSKLLNWIHLLKKNEPVY